MALKWVDVVQSKCLMLHSCPLMQDDTKYLNRSAFRKDIVDWARANGLKLSTWTMRNEAQFLAWDYETDVWAEYDMFLKEVMLTA